MRLLLVLTLRVGTGNEGGLFEADDTRRFWFSRHFLPHEDPLSPQFGVDAEKMASPPWLETLGIPRRAPSDWSKRC